MKGKTYYLYIFRLLKKESPTFRITKQSISVINSILLSTLKTLCKNSTVLMGESRKTLSVKEIVTSLSLLLSTDLFCTVKDFCSSKVIKYNLSSKPVMTTSEKTTRQSKADLIFPVALTENLLRFYMQGDKNISRLCPVYVTAALQILTTILFTLTTTCMRKSKKLLITIRYIREAVKDSQSYSSLLQSANFAFFHGNAAIKKKNTIKDEPDLLQHSPLNRLVKEIVNGHSPNVVLRYTPDFLLNIQAYAEESIFTLAGKAARLTAFAKRDTTFVQDVKLAQELSNDSTDSQRVYITALPEANIRRIVLRGGVKRIGDGTLDAFRTYINDLLEKIV
jgi:histone H3/H4